MRHIGVDACVCKHDATSKKDIDDYFDELMEMAKALGTENSVRRFFNRTEKPVKTRAQVLLDVDFL